MRGETRGKWGESVKHQELWNELYFALRAGKIEWPALAYAESASIVLVLNQDFRVVNGVHARRGPLAACTRCMPNDLVGQHVFPELADELLKWRDLETVLQTKGTEDCRSGPSFFRYFMREHEIVTVYFPFYPGILLCAPAEHRFDGWHRVLELPTPHFLGSKNQPLKSKTAKMNSGKYEKNEKSGIEQPSAPVFNQPEAHGQEGQEPRRHRVLIADDDPFLARALGRALTGSFDVEVAEGGAVALALLEQETFDVVLCDLTMPEVSGAEVFLRVKEMRPEQLSSFVFMTGGVFNDTMSNFLDDVPNPVVDKPFDLRDLREMLYRHACREEG